MPSASVSEAASRRFVPHDFGQKVPNPAKARAAAMEGLGMSLSAAQAHYRPALLAVERALSIPKGRVADLPWRVTVRTGVHLRPLSVVEDMLETVRMQYANGMPIENVAFGNAPAAQAVTALMGIRAVYWRTVNFPPYIALHLYAPLFAAISHAVLDDAPLALGSSDNADSGMTLPAPKLAVYVGHDSNVAPISAILGFGWKMPGGLPNDPQPGGFIMFERLREVNTGERFVRVSYHAQTLDQLRYLYTLGVAPAATASVVSPATSPVASARIDPLSMPFRAEFKAPAAWGTRADNLIPIVQYQAMVQSVAAQACAQAQPQATAK